MNGEHKEKDLEPWDAGELTASEELEPLENDVVSALSVCSAHPSSQCQHVSVIGNTRRTALSLGSW